MSLASHLKELHRKHQALDAQIAREQRRPGSHDLQIRALKKQKLKLKDEIRRSRRPAM